MALVLLGCHLRNAQGILSTSDARIAQFYRAMSHPFNVASVSNMFEIVFDRHCTYCIPISR